MYKNLHLKTAIVCSYLHWFVFLFTQTRQETREVVELDPKEYGIAFDEDEFVYGTDFQWT